MKKSVFGVLCGFAVLAGCGDDASKTVSAVPGTCDVGLVKCTNDLLGTVECGLNGQWNTEVTPCAAATPVCDVTKNKCVAVSVYNCVPRSTKCEDETHYKLCNDAGHWGSTYTCSGNLSKCSTVLNKCVEQNAPEPDCAPASTECVNNQIRTCNGDGNWGAFVSCPSSTPVCDGDGKQCIAPSPSPDCTPLDTECVDNQIRTCNSEGVWGSFVVCSAAAPVCDAAGKQCVTNGTTHECKPRATECADNEIRTCNDDGYWSGWSGCPSATPVCDNDGKQCVSNAPAPVCTPQATECDENNEIRTCQKNGQWSGWSACPAATPVCDVEGKQCVALPPVPECTPDDTECVSNEIRTCDSDGFWGDFVACPVDTPVCDTDGHVCTKIVEPVCTPGVPFCAGGNSKFAGMYECTDDGQIGALIEYCSPGECNEEGTACVYPPECKPDEQKCVDAYAFVGCTSDGKWDNENPRDCNVGFKCRDDLSRCACSPGDKICTFIGTRSEGLYSCNADADIDKSKDLIEHCTCNETFDGCKEDDNKCEVNGARKCDNIDILVCKDNQWQKDSHTCSDSQLCNDSIGSVCISALNTICKSGESICKDGVLMECENGLFREVETPACDDGAPCDFYCLTTSVKPGNRQAEYADKCVDTSYCMDNVRYVCDRDGKITKNACAGKSMKCVMVEESLFGSTKITSKCQNLTCTENSYSCNGDVLSVCGGVSWVKLVDCSVFGLVCDKEAGCIFE